MRGFFEAVFGWHTPTEWDEPEEKEVDDEDLPRSPESLEPDNPQGFDDRFSEEAQTERLDREFNYESEPDERSDERDDEEEDE